MMLKSKKSHLAKFCKVDTWSHELLFTEKQVFLLGFSLTFLRFLPKSKIRLNAILRDSLLKKVCLGIINEYFCHILLMPCFLMENKIIEENVTFSSTL